MVKGLFSSSHQRCSVKKVFLEIPQNSQENTCARISFLIKLKALIFNYETFKQVDVRKLKGNETIHKIKVFVVQT